jgi:hypothetical protein
MTKQAERKRKYVKSKIRIMNTLKKESIIYTHESRTPIKAIQPEGKFLDKRQTESQAKILTNIHEMMMKYQQLYGPKSSGFKNERFRSSFKKFCLYYSSFGDLWLSNDFCRHFEYIRILDENGKRIHHSKLTNEIIDNLTDKQVLKMIKDGYSSKYIYTIELHDDVFIKSIFKNNTPKKVKQDIIKICEKKMYPSKEQFTDEEFETIQKCILPEETQWTKMLIVNEEELPVMCFFEIVLGGYDFRNLVWNKKYDLEYTRPCYASIRNTELIKKATLVAKRKSKKDANGYDGVFSEFELTPKKDSPIRKYNVSLSETINRYFS